MALSLLGSALAAAILFSTGVHAAPVLAPTANLHSNIDVLAPVSNKVFSLEGAYTAGGMAPGPVIASHSSSVLAATTATSTETATTVSTATTRVTFIQTLLASTSISTVYATATQTVFATLTSTSITTATTTASPTSPAAPSAWSLVANFERDQLSSQLGVKTWEWGKSNVAVLTGIPASAWAPAVTASAVAPAASGAKEEMVAPRVDLTNNTVMQVLFPAGSINPANKVAPVGGTGMYMTPLDLSAATNVTLSYSVFFEHGFDFVKGGKLPGLYGGHTGCSGGKESEDCFSTRIMFRANGQGELYLYVPRDVQPAALCETAPLSYCNSPYGLSIGRGAWTFATGAWTNIRQEIRLNTPGIPDGGFRIFVNEKLVLESDAVLFRADHKAPKKSADFKPAPAKSSKALIPAPVQTQEPAKNGGLLGGVGAILGGLKQRERRHPRDFIHVGAISTHMLDVEPEQTTSSSFQRAKWFTQPSLTLVAATTTTAEATPTSMVTVTETSTVPAAVTISKAPARAATPSPAAAHDVASEDNSPLPDAPSGGLVGGLLGTLGLKARPKKLVTFSGAMFDTFFGGHTPDYASTADQYLYFNRVAITINN